jgi:hypothetical protein
MKKREPFFVIPDFGGFSNKRWRFIDGKHER